MKTQPEQTQELLEVATNAFLNISDETMRIGGNLSRVSNVTVDEAENQRTLTFRAENERSSYSGDSYVRFQQRSLDNHGPERRFQVVVTVQELEPVVIRAAGYSVGRNEEDRTAKIHLYVTTGLDTEKIADYIFSEYEVSRKGQKLANHYDFIGHEKVRNPMQKLPMLFRVDPRTLVLDFDKPLEYSALKFLHEYIMGDSEFGVMKRIADGDFNKDETE